MDMLKIVWMDIADIPVFIHILNKRGLLSGVVGLVDLQSDALCICSCINIIFRSYFS